MTPKSGLDLLIEESVKADGKEGRPRTYVQFQGTNICMDFECPCGVYGHLDQSFVFAVKCTGCGRRWRIAPLLLVHEQADDEPDAPSIVELVHEP